MAYITGTSFGTSLHLYYIILYFACLFGVVCRCIGEGCVGILERAVFSSDTLIRQLLGACRRRVGEPRKRKHCSEQGAEEGT